MYYITWFYIVLYCVHIHSKLDGLCIKALILLYRKTLHKIFIRQNQTKALSLHFAIVLKCSSIACIISTNVIFCICVCFFLAPSPKGFPRIGSVHNIKWSLHSLVNHILSPLGLTYTLQIQSVFCSIILKPTSKLDAKRRRSINLFTG